MKRNKFRAFSITSWDGEETNIYLQYHYWWGWRTIKTWYNITDSDWKKADAMVDVLNTYNTMQPFNGNADNIPEVPILPKYIYKKHIVPNLIRCGAISKKDLKVGATYLGSCRNADKAKWKGKFFTYDRYKWGATYTDRINHFQDDDGADLFVPIKEI